MHLPQSKNVCPKIGQCELLFLDSRLAMNTGAKEEDIELGKRKSFFIHPPHIIFPVDKRKKMRNS